MSLSSDDPLKVVNLDSMRRMMSQVKMKSESAFKPCDWSVFIHSLISLVYSRIYIGRRLRLLTQDSFEQEVIWTQLNLSILVTVIDSLSPSVSLIKKQTAKVLDDEEWWMQNIKIFLKKTPMDIWDSNNLLTMHQCINTKHVT